MRRSLLLESGTCQESAERIRGLDLRGPVSFKVVEQLGIEMRGRRDSMLDDLPYSNERRRVLRAAIGIDA